MKLRLLNTSLLPHARRCAVIGIGCLAVTCSCWAAAPPPAAPAPAKGKPAPSNAPPAVVEIPKSIFVDDPKTGKDPFFPASSRRNPKPPPKPPEISKPGEPSVPGKPVPPPEPPKPPPPASQFLSVKAIFGYSSKHPLASIYSTVRSYDFEVGDALSVRVPEETKIPGGQVKIRCVEIKPESVVIEVEGESGRKELKLRRGI